MTLFRRKVPNYLIPIHRDNATTKDWVVLLEAGTIVGPSPDRLRVARTTQDRKIVKKYNLLMQARYYLVVEGFDSRIHGVYFCPQLYKYDSDKKLIPLQGEEIGRLIAHALESGIKGRQPWYEPADRLPGEQVISSTPHSEFDTLVVDMPSRDATPRAQQARASDA